MNLTDMITLARRMPAPAVSSLVSVADTSLALAIRWRSVGGQISRHMMRASALRYRRTAAAIGRQLTLELHAR